MIPFHCTQRIDKISSQIVSRVLSDRSDTRPEIKFSYAITKKKWVNHQISKISGKNWRLTLQLHFLTHYTP